MSILYRQPVGDLVIITLVGDENMRAQHRAGRAIKRAHRDRQTVAAGCIPEQK